MYFTIVTVVLNDLENLKTTIESVHNQSFFDYEHIIVDGMSDDGTKEYIEKILVKYPKIKYFRKKDDGLYFAMNNAVKMAKGEYTVFLNAGDVFFDGNTLQSVYDENQMSADVFYGFSIYSSGDRTGEKVGGRMTPFFVRSGKCVSHQAVFEKTELLKRHPFDTRFKIQADQEQLLYWYKNNALFYYTDRALCLYDGCGLSSNKLSEVISLRERVAIHGRYFKITFLPFFVLAKIKLLTQYRDVKQFNR